MLTTPFGVGTRPTFRTPTATCGRSPGTPRGKSGNRDVVRPELPDTSPRRTNPAGPQVTSVMPNSRRSSLPSVENRLYTRQCRENPEMGGTDLVRKAQDGISTPLSTFRWIPLAPVSHYHRRQPDGRRMEMLLEYKNAIT